jgi:hypothetical protein
LTRITSSLYGTSSWSTNSLTSSYITASNVVGTVTSASYALSASYAPVNTSVTSSWATNALTASSINFVPNIANTASYYNGSVISSSYSLSSSYAPTNTNITASWSINSLTASSINFVPNLANTASYYNGSVISSSYALTSSYALNTGTTLVTGSTYPITSSWSINTITASYLVPTNSYQVTNLTASGDLIYKNSVLLDFGSASLATTGALQVITQVLTGSYNAAFYNYCAISGANSRAGTVIANWNNNSSQITYTEYATTDIGDTTQLQLSAALSGGYVQFLANTTGSISWSVKVAAQYL